LATTKVKTTKIDKKPGILTFHTPWINRLRLKKAILTNPNKTLTEICKRTFPNAVNFEEIEYGLNLYPGTLAMLAPNSLIAVENNTKLIDNNVDYTKESLK